MFHALRRLALVRNFVAVAVGVALAVGLGYYQFHTDTARVVDMQQTAESAKPGVQVPPSTVKLGGPFTLHDQNGKPVSDSDFRGRYMLVYFGFTFCPDMCPTGLATVGRALDKLGDEAAKIAPIFITIDPERDTPERLKNYVAEFHPSILGLSGTTEQTKTVTDAYHVYFKKTDTEDGPDYLMDHSAMIYLMDKQGNYLEAFDEEEKPDVLAAELRKAIDVSEGRGPTKQP